jgi:hypothetical protein
LSNPANTNPKSTFVEEIQSGREFQDQGHWAKVTTPRDTPLSPDISYSFRRYSGREFQG